MGLGFEPSLVLAHILLTSILHLSLIVTYIKFLAQCLVCGRFHMDGDGC